MLVFDGLSLPVYTLTAAPVMGKALRPCQFGLMACRRTKCPPLRVNGVRPRPDPVEFTLPWKRASKVIDSPNKELEPRTCDKKLGDKRIGHLFVSNLFVVNEYLVTSTDLSDIVRYSPRVFD
jgi:hypothetical protein